MCIHVYEYIYIYIYICLCCLQCAPEAQDSIEHYACCPVIRTAALALLRLELRPWPAALGDFLLFTDPPWQDPSVDLPRRRLRMAILVTAAYRTANCPAVRTNNSSRDWGHDATGHVGGGTQSSGR